MEEKQTNRDVLKQSQESEASIGNTQPLIPRLTDKATLDEQSLKYFKCLLVCTREARRIAGLIQTRDPTKRQLCWLALALDNQWLQMHKYIHNSDWTRRYLPEDPEYEEVAKQLPSILHQLLENVRYLYQQIKAAGIPGNPCLDLQPPATEICRMLEANDDLLRQLREVALRKERDPEPSSGPTEAEQSDEEGWSEVEFPDTAPYNECPYNMCTPFISGLSHEDCKLEAELASSNNVEHASASGTAVGGEVSGIPVAVAGTAPPTTAAAAIAEEVPKIPVPMVEAILPRTATG